MSLAALNVIQDGLEAVYGLDGHPRASEYLVDGETARALGGAGGGREEVLVQEGPDALHLALYVAPEVLRGVGQALEGPLPHRAVELCLDGFCQAVEGVSHFLYLARSAALERRVSLLELEAQAEVDKFVLCALTGTRQELHRRVQWLGAALFKEVQLRPGLSAAERHRYLEASRLAQLFCARLTRLFRAGRLELVLEELRRMYRLGSEAKLRYLVDA